MVNSKLGGFELNKRILDRASPRESSDIQAQNQSRKDSKPMSSESSKSFDDSLRKEAAQERRDLPGDGRVSKTLESRELDRPTENSGRVGSNIENEQLNEGSLTRSKVSLPEEEEDQIQKPVLDFMDSMESEFGIGPERLLGAMANMTDDELLNPPNETIDRFMENLELPPEDHQKAIGLYKNMLQEIDKVDTKSGKFEQEVKMEVLSPQELREKKLLRSIEKLNKKFFLNDTRPSYGKGQKIQNEKVEDPVDQINKDFINTKLNSKTQNQTKQQVVPQQSYAPQVKTQNQENSQKIHQSNVDSKLAAMGITSAASIEASRTAGTGANSIDQTGKMDISGMQMQPMNVQASESNGLNLQSDSQSGFNTSDNSGQMAQFNELNKADVEADPQLAEEGAVFSVEGETQGNETQVKKTELFTRTEPTQSERVSNLREIAQGARALVRQGGGEMTVNLNPEGMGELQLKVNVAQGKVDVQMLTSNSEVKKHIEQNLNDLRVGMSDQKLNLDSVKVEVSDQIRQEMDMNNQQEHGRQNAREFLQQFRDQNQSFRNAFFTGPDRGPTEPRERPEVKPEDGASRSSGRSKHIDVIA